MSCFYRSFSLEFTAKWGCWCWCMTWVSFALANLEENSTWQQLLILLHRVVCWFCQLWDLLWGTRSRSFCWIWQSHGKNPCCKLDLWAQLLIGNAGSFGACSFFLWRVLQAQCLIILLLLPAMISLSLSMLSVFTVFCNVLFFICKFAKFTSSGMDAVHYTSFFKTWISLSLQKLQESFFDKHWVFSTKKPHKFLIFWKFVSILVFELLASSIVSHLSEICLVFWLCS